jgi:homoserine kinase type II
MAVYTPVSAETLAAMLGDYDVGTLLSAKGIAEGVSNSNFLVETTGGRFVLTLYERRIDAADLPFFLDLMEHLAARGLPVPRPVRDGRGDALRQVEGRSACLVTWLPGVSLARPGPVHAGAAGRALARLHLAAADFPGTRANSLGPDWWQETARALGPGLDTLSDGLGQRVVAALEQVRARWPAGLPTGIVHADLFPDNVLMLGTQVTGLIDFYFACTDLLAYDLAVLHTAWCFDPATHAFLPDHEQALVSGYHALRPLLPEERAALPILCMGASLRFLLSRAQDWLEPRGDELAQRKDPLPFLHRLDHYAVRA